jgi:hypothetical protein
MDLKVYYAAIREVAATILDEFAVVVSLKTDDGGREGVLMEVDRQSAAKMVIDKRAVIATPEQAEAFRAEQKQKYEKAVRDASAGARVYEVFAKAGLDALKKSLTEQK